uniref:Uncharacterized protein n=1 Tax=Knipowitschia caucasica TaxID=637954 RepID=A0AAV2K2P8_KNICA
MFVWQNAEEAQHQPEASSQPPHPTSPLCKPRCRALYQYIGQDTDENSASKSMTSFELAQRRVLTALPLTCLYTGPLRNGRADRQQLAQGGEGDYCLNCSFKTVGFKSLFLPPE